MIVRRQNFVMVGLALITFSFWGLLACGDHDRDGTAGDGSGIIGDADDDGVPDADDVCPRYAGRCRRGADRLQSRSARAVRRPACRRIRGGSRRLRRGVRRRGGRVRRCGIDHLRPEGCGGRGRRGVILRWRVVHSGADLDSTTDGNAGADRDTHSGLRRRRRHGRRRRVLPLGKSSTPTAAASVSSRHATASGRTMAAM